MAMGSTGTDFSVTAMTLVTWGRRGEEDCACRVKFWLVPQITVKCGGFCLGVLECNQTALCYVSFIPGSKLSWGGCKWTEAQLHACLHQQSKLASWGVRYLRGHASLHCPWACRKWGNSGDYSVEYWSSVFQSLSARPYSTKNDNGFWYMLLDLIVKSHKPLLH